MLSLFFANTPAPGGDFGMIGGVAAAAAGGFAAWALNRIVTHFVLRHRLKRYLKSIFNLHFRNARVNLEWLKRMMTTILPGRAVNGAAYYTKDDLKDLACMRSRFLSLLGKHELTKVAKCINMLFEVEALFDGFCKSLVKLQDKASILNEGDVHYLTQKAARIEADVNALPPKIGDIEELPDDYAGVIQPAILVPPPSSVPTTPKA